MREPLWKRLLSYFVEFHIESEPSDYNPHLYVSLRQGRYQLATANAVYSYGDLYTNFFRAFEKTGIEKRSLENVLLLGLGLGSIPLMLHKNFGKKEVQFTAVEIDEAVIYLANKYVLRDLDANINCVQADALQFVQLDQQSYDLICMDVFQDDVIPAEFEEPEFLLHLQRLLSPDGILLFNRLALTSADRRGATRYFKEVFLSVFPNAAYLDVDSNYILVNDKSFLQ